MSLISLTYLIRLILDCTIFLEFNNALTILCSRNWKKKESVKEQWIWFDLYVKIQVLQQWWMGWGNSWQIKLSEKDEQPLRISTAFKSKTYFKEMASTPCNTFCIPIASKMVDNLKSCVNERQHIIDSSDLKHVYVLSMWSI